MFKSFTSVRNISHAFVLSHSEEIDITHGEWKLSDVISLPMGGEFLTWGTSISPHATLSSQWEKKIKGNFTRDATCDISHVRFSDSHGTEPSHGMVLRWSLGVQGFFWLGTVYLQDLYQERFGIYALHARLDQERALHSINPTTFRYLKMSIPVFNSAGHRSLSLNGRQWMIAYFYLAWTACSKIALNWINRTTKIFLKFQPLF